MLKNRFLSLILPPALLIFSLNVSAQGGFLDGNKLYEYAKSYHRVENSSAYNAVDQTNAFYYYGYITATSDTFNNTEQLCVPLNVSTSQLADIAYRYLHDNPEKRQYTASSSLYVAFKTAFPDSTCK